MEDIDELREPLLTQGVISSHSVQIEPQGIPIYYDEGLHHAGTTPFSTSPIFGISDDGHYEHLGGTEVLFLNLTEETTVFDKVQSRRGGETKMRVQNGRIKMVCQSPSQIMCIKVYVFRELSAAKLCGDDNGRMELPVKMENMEVQDNSGTCKQFFSVDLNSIYHGPKKPAYELAKVETEQRNQFQLTVEVQYGGGSMYQEFTSIPFLLRTKTRPKKDNGKPKAGKRMRLPDSINSDDQVQSPDTSRPRLDNGVFFDKSQYSPDSMISTADCPNIECQRLNVLDHLRAKHASIEHLTFNVMESTANADIGYRFALKTSHLEAYDEGDVVGFFKDEDGGNYIDLLDSTNAGDAFMAGVITRSAYLEAKQSLDYDDSDVVCVIGVVKVKCMGTVRAGERIYSALMQGGAGTAIAESHLSPGMVLNKRGTLLGMSLEEKKAKKTGEETMVKCFVCIVMGITDKKITMEIESAFDRVEVMVNDKVKKERKRAKRVLCIAMSVLVFLLIGLSLLTYQLFYPGSALRELICREGSMKGHYVTFKFTSTAQTQTYFVTGVEFSSWEKLKKKVEPALDHEAPLDPKLFNITNVHYYFNLYRCSYGIKLQSTLKIDPKKQAGGPLIFAVDGDCTTVYWETDVVHDNRKGCKKNWCPYQSVSSYPDKFHCYPKSEFRRTHN